MPVQWENEGEPVDGEYRARITFTDGRPPQVFHGPDHKAVADALLAAQENASNAIASLKAGRQPDPATPRRPRIEPKPMTGAEQMQASVDLGDPKRAPAAVTRIVESVLGPVDKVREVLNQGGEEDEAAQAERAAAEFAAQTPEWYPSDRNLRAIVRHMQLEGIPPTSAKNFSIAFDTLMQDGVLQMRPQEEEPPPTERRPPQAEHRPATRPRGTLTTTSIRASDTSGSPPRPRPRYTRADIDKMPKDVYRQKLESEPGFEQLVASLYK